jgi:hypothetical protein
MNMHATVEHRKLVATAAAIIFAWFTAAFGQWPDIFGLTVETDPAAALPVASLVHMPVHLADDVMISLRSGYMETITGRPAFNRTDVAQPSTSYLTPYLFATLLNLMQLNAAVWAYALLGLIATAATMGLIVWRARATVQGLLMAFALCCTSTNLEFALNGWDHLFQAPFLVAATILALDVSLTSIGILSVSLLLVLGSLFRPDGLLISLAIIVAMVMPAGRLRRVMLLCALPYSLMMAGFLAFNAHLFSHITPTTARLKFGSSPSWPYSLHYAVSNGLLTYSAISVLLALIGLYAIFRRVLPDRRLLVVLIGCVLTASVALYNSDVFPGARMFWVPTCVFCAAMAALLPECLLLNPSQAISLTAYSRGQIAASSASWTLRISQWVVIALALLWVSEALVSPIVNQAKRAVIRTVNIQKSSTARQYLFAHWISEHLNPRDGPIALSYLGMGFHMPQFEIADLLGKADERIATSPIKWGPPGHNKWDIDATLEKWRPQAFVIDVRTDFHDQNVLHDAQTALATKQDMAFRAALILNPRVQQEYTYCRLTDIGFGIPDRQGFLLRRDVAARQEESVTCH